jgi:2-polyprenyl-3-methyl-5-hydroxy-6-metoxy-1,4-benzoquinol methylase
MVEAERLACCPDASIQGLFEILRKLSLDEFGQLLIGVPEQFRNLKNLLPRMASDEVQKNWTGNSGVDLLRQSCAFMRTVERGWYSHKRALMLEKKSLRVLDYGCGWGRLVRLLYYYTQVDCIFGVDAWDQSIEICRECNLPGKFDLVDYIPTSLPDGYHSFDLIISFSVFTHLSERTMEAVLAVLSNSIMSDGILVATIRPVEYWGIHQNYPEGYSRERLTERHQRAGFAFMPHNRPPIDGEVTYGDTSMSLEYIARNWNGWHVVGTDYNLVDPYQLVVFLTPV